MSTLGASDGRSAQLAAEYLGLCLVVGITQFFRGGARPLIHVRCRGSGTATIGQALSKGDQSTSTFHLPLTVSRFRHHRHLESQRRRSLVGNQTSILSPPDLLSLRVFHLAAVCPSGWRRVTCICRAFVMPKHLKYSWLPWEGTRSNAPLQCAIPSRACRPLHLLEPLKGPG